MATSTRPGMNARDSSGRCVSLLNEDISTPYFRSPRYSSHYSAYDYENMARSNSNSSARSNASPPGTPGLVRADSFDSQNTHDSRSPVTPTLVNEFGRQASYTSSKSKDHSKFDYRDKLSFEDYSANSQYPMPIRPPYNDSRSSSSFADSQLYDEDSYQNSSTSERGQKRYPCRFREALGCEKTFTTSGHASRHSKIHTAEKGVACEFPGCPKKFTRADNMKQHLETHTKDRSRSSTGSHKSTMKSNLTFSSGVKKPSSRPSRPSSRNAGPSSTELPPLVDPALYGYPGTNRAAPTSPHSHYTTYQLNGPVTDRRENTQSGLDVLVMAADYQNHSQS